MLLRLDRALVMVLVAQQAAASAPSNPPQKYFLAFSSPFAEEADGGCCRDREDQGQQCQSLSQDLCGVMKTSNPHHLPQPWS